MELAQRFEILSVPTVIVFNVGTDKDRLVCFIPKNNLKAKVEEYL